MVCEALADGSYFPRGSSAPGVRDAETLVREGDPEERSGAVGPLLGGHPISKKKQDKGRERRTANGLVRQEVSDLLRRSGGGRQRVMGRRADFLRVVYGQRDGKSPR